MTWICRCLMIRYFRWRYVINTWWRVSGSLTVLSVLSCRTLPSSRCRVRPCRTSAASVRRAAAGTSGFPAWSCRTAEPSRAQQNRIRPLRSGEKESKQPNLLTRNNGVWVVRGTGPKRIEPDLLLPDEHWFCRRRVRCRYRYRTGSDPDSHQRIQVLELQRGRRVMNCHMGVTWQRTTWAAGAHLSAHTGTEGTCDVTLYYFSLWVTY